MSVIDIAKKRIDDGITKIFTPKEYPVFLTFASNFLNFSYKNIILIYLQDPQAQYVAGINAWKNLTGLGIKKGATPILILYPDLANGFHYEVQKLFDYRQVDNENINAEMINEYIFKCDKNTLFESISRYLKEFKVSVYLNPEVDKKICVEDNIITVNASLDNDEKFMEVLKLHIENQAKDKKYEPLLSGAIINTSIYLIYSYYGFIPSQISFPYLAIPITDDKKNFIFSQSFSLARRTIESLDNFYFQKMKEKSGFER